jgi:hypothetical protein
VGLALVLRLIAEEAGLLATRQQATEPLPRQHRSPIHQREHGALGSPASRFHRVSDYR